MWISAKNGDLFDVVAVRKVRHMEIPTGKTIFLDSVPDTGIPEKVSGYAIMGNLPYGEEVMLCAFLDRDGKAEEGADKAVSEITTALRGKGYFLRPF